MIGSVNREGESRCKSVGLEGEEMSDKARRCGEE